MINGYHNITNRHNHVGTDIIRPWDLYYSTGMHPANHIMNVGELPPSVSAYAEPAPIAGSPNRFCNKPQFAYLTKVHFK